MNEELQRAVEYIQLIADRAIQRGNVFANMNEAIHFQNCLNKLITIVNSVQQAKANGE
jgi:hypothetical protein